MSLENLIQRIEAIHDKCRDPREKKEKEKEEAALDTFTRLKKQIAKDVQETRKQIIERNDLLGQSDNTVATAKMSSSIRTRIRQIENDIDELETIQKKDETKMEKRREKGKEVDEKDVKENEYRVEIIDLCRKHVTECQHLEKSGFGNVANSFFDGYTKKDDKVVTKLPDIDDDEAFLYLKNQDLKIDAKLELVSQGVAHLKDMALEMGNEVDRQAIAISELTQKVDDTQATLNNLNKRLKKTLQKVRKGDRFCIDIILIVIILAIGGYIYNVVRKS